MRKPASAQSDQRLCCTLPRKYNTFPCEIQNSVLPVSVAKQAGLSLTWLQPKTGFLMTGPLVIIHKHCNQI